MQRRCQSLEGSKLMSLQCDSERELCRESTLSKIRHRAATDRHYWSHGTDTDIRPPVLLVSIRRRNAPRGTLFANHQERPPDEQPRRKVGVRGSIPFGVALRTLAVSTK